MQLLTILSAVMIIHFCQFAPHAFAVDPAGPSGSGQGVERVAGQEDLLQGEPADKKALIASESIQAELRAMNIGEARVQEVIALIYSKPLYKAFLIDGNKEAKSSQYDYTSLHEAAHHGHLEVARLILAQGAAVGAQTTIGSAPLYSAAHHGHLEVARLILARGAAVDAPARSGFTPLAIARQRFAEVPAGDDERRLIFQNIIDLLEQQTAFHQRNAVALMSYIYQGKSIDLDLMKANLKYTEFNEVKLRTFLEALQVQVQQPAPADAASEVRVFLDGQEQTLQVQEAIQKIIELVDRWYHTQRLCAAVRNGSDLHHLFNALFDHPLSIQHKLATNLLGEILKGHGNVLNQVSKDEKIMHAQFIKELISEVLPEQYIRDLQPLKVKPFDQYLPANLPTAQP